MPNQALPKTLKNWFTLRTVSRTHNKRMFNSGCLKIPSYNTKLYRRHSVYISAIFTQNYLQILNSNILFYQLPLSKLMSMIKKILYN